MEIRYSTEISNEEVDNMMTRWLGLYIIAREKYGNYNYDDKYDVMKKYIDNYYDYDYTQYVIDLASSDNLKDQNELMALKNCEDILPLMFWRNMKRTFKIKEEYFEERLKYNYDKLINT